MESKNRVTYKLLKKYYQENKNNIEMCGLKCKFDNENVCEPGKIKISNNSDIRRKRAGFDFAGNSKISEQIQNLLNNQNLSNNMNVKTKINGMDVENFKKTKEKYQNLKNELDENLEKFRQFIEICCENLEIDSKKNPKSLKFKNNKNFDDFNKELTALNPRYKIEEKYKNNMDKIELKIKGENGIIKKFENSIKSLRGNLFNQGINPSKYYMRFAEKLNNLILKIDKKLKNVDPKVSDISTEIKNLISKQKTKIENTICFNNFDSKSKILGLKKLLNLLNKVLN